MKELKVIQIDELHSSIRNFIIKSERVIGDYEDMKGLVLTMIRAGYMFNMDRDRLRDAMEDITYMLCPDDDANKDRVERGLEYEDEDEDDDYDSEDENRRDEPSAGLSKSRITEEAKQDPIKTEDNIEDIGNTSNLN